MTLHLQHQTKNMTNSEFWDWMRKRYKTTESGAKIKFMLSPQIYQHGLIKDFQLKKQHGATRSIISK